MDEARIVVGVDSSTYRYILVVGVCTPLRELHTIRNKCSLSEV